MMLKDKPMFTADKMPIIESMIVYTKNIYFSSYDRKEEKADFVANRVFHVNNKDRCFRIRNPKGHEFEISMRDGRSAEKVFAKKCKIRSEIKIAITGKIKDINSDLDKKRKGWGLQVEKNKKQVVKFCKFKTDLAKFNPEMPK